MSFLNLNRRKLAAAAGAGLVLVGGGTAAAYAATGGASPTTSAANAAVVLASTTGTSSPAAAPAATGGKALRIRALLARTDYATVEVKAKGSWVTYTVNRGRLTAVSATSVTVLRPDGDSVTVAVTATTKIRGLRGAPSLQTGHNVEVVSGPTGAIVIIQGKVPAAAGAPST